MSSQKANRKSTRFIPLLKEHVLHKHGNVPINLKELHETSVEDAQKQMSHRNIPSIRWKYNRTPMALTLMARLPRLFRTRS